MNVDQEIGANVAHLEKLIEEGKRLLSNEVVVDFLSPEQWIALDRNIQEARKIKAQIQILLLQRECDLAVVSETAQHAVKAFAPLSATIHQLQALENHSFSKN